MYSYKSSTAADKSIESTKVITARCVLSDNILPTLDSFEVYLAAN